MAEEIVDALVLAARFDEQGLDDSGRKVLAAARSVSEAVAKAGGTSAQAAVALSNLAKRSLEAAAAFQKAGVSQEQLNALLERSGLLARHTAAALLDTASAARALASAGGGGGGGRIPTLLYAGGGGGNGGSPNDPSKILAGQLQQLKPRIDGVAAAIAPMNVLLAQATTQSIRAADAASLLAQKWGASIGPLTDFAATLGRASTALSSQFTQRMADATNSTASLAARASTVPPVLSTLIAGMSQVANVSNRMVAGMTAAAAGTGQMGVAAEKAAAAMHPMASAMSRAAAASTPMTRAMSTAAGSVESMGARARDVSTHVGRLHHQFGIVARGSDSAEAGIARVRSGLAQLAIVSAGTVSPVGQIAQGLLFIGGVSSVGIIAAAGATLGLVLAYEKLTAGSRRAKDAQKELLNALLQSAEASQPGAQAQEAGRVAARARAVTLVDQELGLERRLAAIGWDFAQALGLRLRLRLNLNEQARISAALEEETVRRIVEAGNAERTRQGLAIQRAAELNRTRLEGLAEETRFRRALAEASGMETFGAEPGSVSREVLNSFRERLDLSRAITGADLEALEAQKKLAQVGLRNPAATEEQIQTAQDRVRELDHEIQIRRTAGELQLKAITNERDLLTATRDRIILERAHLERVAAVGGGNLLGKAPVLAPDVGFGRGANRLIDPITKRPEILPTDAEVDKLRRELAAIPPIGLPTAADFEAQRRALLPLILQGAQQQGLESQGAVGHAGEFDQMVKDIRKATAEAKLYAAAIKAARTEGEKMADSLTDIGSVAFGLADAGSALRLIGDEAADSLNAVGQLADALAQVALSASTGNIIGAAVAGAGLIGGLFGKDATQLEHERIQEQNTEAIERNTAAIEAAGTSGGRAAIRQTLAGISPETRAFLDKYDKQALPLANRWAGIDSAKELDKQLKASGSSLKELQLVAEANGIQLLDSKGRLVAGSLDALDKQLKKSAEEAAKRGTSISEREAKLRIEDKLGIGGRSTDPDVAAVERARQIQLDALNLSEAEEARIRALDLSTKEGREAYKAWNAELFKRAEGLTDAERGAFANTGELDASIESAADSVNAFDDAVSEATKSLTNIPETFKLASAEWAARDVDRGGATRIPFAPVNGTGFAPGLRGTDGSQLPVTQVTGNTIVFQVTVNGKNMSDQDVARRVADELEYRGIATFGLAPPP